MLVKASGGNLCFNDVPLGSVTGAAAFNASAGNVVSLTAAGNVTLTISNIKAGMLYSIDFTQDGTGNRTLTIAGVTVVGPSLSPAAIAGSRSIITFIAVSSTVIQQVAAGVLTMQTSIVESPTDQPLILQSGLDGAGPDREPVRVNLGALDAGTNISGALQLSHPALGPLCTWDLRGTAGSPDTVANVTKTVTGACVTASSGAFNVTATSGGMALATTAGAVSITAGTAGLNLTANGATNIIQTCGASNQIRCVGHSVTNAAGSATILDMNTTTGVVTIGDPANRQPLGLQVLTQTTVGAAGAATALPAQPTGYLRFSIQGNARVVPFYLES
jgi:hypothetical protein